MDLFSSSLSSAIFGTSRVTTCFSYAKQTVNEFPPPTSSSHKTFYTYTKNHYFLMDFLFCFLFIQDYIQSEGKIRKSSISNQRVSINYTEIRISKY